MMKVCPQCAFINDDSSKFCGNCATFVEQIVPVKPDKVDKIRNEILNELQTSPLYVYNGEFIIKRKPEEKRLKKFAKYEKKAARKISLLAAPIAGLCSLCASEEEYRKAANYFEAWVNQYVIGYFRFLSSFDDMLHWDNFRKNCIFGLLSLMVIGDYKKCLWCSNILLGFERSLYMKKIWSSPIVSGSIFSIAGAELKRKERGVKMQREFMSVIKLFKAVCLCNLGRYEDAHEILIRFSPDYSIRIDFGNDYYNQNFRYADGFFASHFLDLAERFQ